MCKMSTFGNGLVTVSHNKYYYVVVHSSSPAILMVIHMPMQIAKDAA